MQTNTINAYGLGLCLDQRLLDGLSIFPQAATSPGESRVSVRLDRPPDSLPEPKERGACWQASPGHFLLRLPDHGAFYVRDGNEILAEPHPDTSPATMTTFLFASVMAALLTQRGLFVTHGSAVAFEDGCAIFTGDSGAGKSTLAAGLLQRGYKVQTDDLCAMQRGDDGVVRLLPGPPWVKVCETSARALHIETEGLQRVRGELRKFYLPIEPRPEPIPVRHLVSITTRGSIGATAITEQTGAQRLEAAVQSTYRPAFFRAMGHEPDRFRTCAALTKQAAFHHLDRANGQFSETLDLLEEALR